MLIHTLFACLHRSGGYLMRQVPIRPTCHLIAKSIHHCRDHHHFLSHRHHHFLYHHHHHLRHHHHHDKDGSRVGVAILSIDQGGSGRRRKKKNSISVITIIIATTITIFITIVIIVVANATMISASLGPLSQPFGLTGQELIHESWSIFIMMRMMTLVVAVVMVMVVTMMPIS